MSAKSFKKDGVAVNRDRLDDEFINAAAHELGIA
jgi:hypothetical protein